MKLRRSIVRKLITKVVQEDVHIVKNQNLGLSHILKPDLIHGLNQYAPDGELVNANHVFQDVIQENVDN